MRPFAVFFGGKGAVTHLSLGPQVLLGVDLEGEPLGDLQLLDVSGGGHGEAGQPPRGRRRARRGPAPSAAPAAGRRQVLHPLLGVEHALDLLVNLRGEDINQSHKSTEKCTPKYTQPNPRNKYIILAF